MNMQSLLKQAQKMQKELAKAEELLNEQTYDSTMGGGVVKVTVKGSMEIETICIDEALLEKDGFDIVKVHFERRRKGISI